jgi:hypothetical protein
MQVLLGRHVDLVEVMLSSSDPDDLPVYISRRSLHVSVARGARSR